MSDLNDKVEERWKSRRKKGYNWPKLIAMLLILIALIYVMGILGRMGEKQTMIMSTEQDSVEAKTEIQDMDTMGQKP
ncbi:MAG: hypothetical protein PHY41_07725 [Candidatus Cloacimonetes bacterium]|nr:hypothetical protein [Candidatus Cloacimonadota bacterium]MCK9332626.1 hypothetical protein [Candidatus Cloacimonadota bacterium]MDD3283345.1 hypothetical protein [Candidatus Cloacimonadota bacterium]MDD4231944.1 hypothetical protein [Candidatus Cloacimonadota bacterium]MDD4687089.1 hypothetical protein [Candidatus Cloacimonadota bacterium]